MASSIKRDRLLCLNVGHVSSDRTGIPKWAGRPRACANHDIMRMETTLPRHRFDVIPHRNVETYQQIEHALREMVADADVYGNLFIFISAYQYQDHLNLIYTTNGGPCSLREKIEEFFSRRDIPSAMVEKRKFTFIQACNGGKYKDTDTDGETKPEKVPTTSNVATYWCEEPATKVPGDGGCSASVSIFCQIVDGLTEHMNLAHILTELNNRLSKKLKEIHPKSTEVPLSKATDIDHFLIPPADPAAAPAAAAADHGQ